MTFDFKYEGFGFPGERVSLELVDGIWYLPAASYPKFTVSVYKGTVRRIQYTMNNTDPTRYQPPPCMIDWPEGTFEGVQSWEIGHCPNVVY